MADIKRISKWIYRALGNILFVCLLLILSAIIFFLVQSRINGGPPTVSGYKLFTVMSGSMSPAIKTGSLVAVKPVRSSQLQEGDIITFGALNGKVTTHRIVDIETEGGLGFVTKGDANDVADSGIVPAARVVGVVSLAIPWAGRILVFSRTKQGLLLMIIIPALIIMFLEARGLWLYAVQVDKEKKRKASETTARLIE